MRGLPSFHDVNAGYKIPLLNHNNNYHLPGAYIQCSESKLLTKFRSQFLCLLSCDLGNLFKFPMSLLSHWIKTVDINRTYS